MELTLLNFSKLDILNGCLENREAPFVAGPTDRRSTSFYNVLSIP
jgi:hypothetical protein